MATITLDFDPPDLPVSVTLTALRRVDTDAAVPLPVPPDFTHTGDGVWAITFAEPQPGLVYAYDALATWDDATTSPFSGTQEGDATPAGDPRRQDAKWTVTVPPVARPVTWAEAKAHLRLDTDEQQAYVETLITAATDYAEDRLASALMPQTVLATFYDGEPIKLPRGPLLDVLAIVDRDGASLTDYDLAHAGHAARIVLNQGGAGYPVSVTYRAGYADAAAIPASIKLGILCHVGTMFENRESAGDRVRHVVPHSMDDFYRLKGRGVCVG